MNRSKWSSAGYSAEWMVGRLEPLFPSPPDRTDESAVQAAQGLIRISHVARHTYATRCLNRGIRLEVVAILLGHSTTKITQHYAKLLKNSILGEVKDAFEKSY